MEENINLATVHFYRTKNWFGFLIRPKLLMNFNPISTIKRNWKKTITVPTGTYIFSAATEVRKKIELQVEAGKQYFVKCSLKFGFFVGRIEFTLMDAEKAKQEMKGLRAED